MFREIVRKKQILSEEECISILKETKRGVLSVNGDNGYPYGMPINHYYDEETGKLYFHGGMFGHKIDAMRNDPKVSFCVYDDGTQYEGDWFLTLRSVIVFGTVEFIEDRETVYEISRRLSYKFTDDREYIEKEVSQSGPRTLMFAVTIENMQGKRVTER